MRLFNRMFHIWNFLFFGWCLTGLAVCLHSGMWRNVGVYLACTITAAYTTATHVQTCERYGA